MTNLEQRLRAALNPEDAPEGEAPHLDPARIAQVVEGRARLTLDEAAHAAGCASCRGALVVTTQVQAPPRPQGGWLWGGAVGGALCAAAMLFAVRGGDEWRARGAAVDAHSPAVTWLAVEGDAVRTLTSGATLQPGVLLGFRYGNPSGAARTLTLLAWGGGQVHWLYPEAPGGPAFALRAGPEARAVRLPEDVEVDDTFVPGPLLLCAAFAAAPPAVAEALARGACPGPALEVTVASKDDP